MTSTPNGHRAARSAGLSSVVPTMDATEHGPTVTIRWHDWVRTP